MAKPDTLTMAMPDAAELKAADENIGIVHIVCGQTAKGKDFYAYLAIKPSRYEEFLTHAQRGEPMNLEEFGEILTKAYGKEPPQAVKKVMEEKYGVDHDFIKHLREEAEKIHAASEKKSSI